MKLKLDENGNVVVQEGKPVYVHDDGKELPFDASAAMQKIGTLNAEAKQHREAKEAAESKLKAFDGIDDVALAKKAVETMKHLDDKKLIDAGEAEKVKSEAIKLYEEKLAAAEAEKVKIQQQFHSELIGGSFARSKVIADKLAIPVEVAQAFFGRHFAISDEGQVIAKDAHGNEIYSRVTPGAKANFDEALETLIDAYPNKANILKGSGSSGGHGSASGAGNNGAPSSYTECKTDAEKVAYLQANKGD